MLILVSIELFPMLLISRIDPAYSITVYNRAFWGKVKRDDTSY